jgi:hypothetical protein
LEAPVSNQQTDNQQEWRDSLEEGVMKARIIVLVAMILALFGLGMLTATLFEDPEWAQIGSVGASDDRDPTNFHVALHQN